MATVVNKVEITHDNRIRLNGRLSTTSVDELMKFGDENSTLEERYEKLLRYKYNTNTKKAKQKKAQALRDANNAVQINLVNRYINLHDTYRVLCRVYDVRVLVCYMIQGNKNTKPFFISKNTLKKLALNEYIHWGGWNKKSDTFQCSPGCPKNMGEMQLKDTGLKSMDIIEISNTNIPDRHRDRYKLTKVLFGRYNKLCRFWLTDGKTEKEYTLYDMEILGKEKHFNIRYHTENMMLGSNLRMLSRNTTVKDIKSIFGDSVKIEFNDKLRQFKYDDIDEEFSLHIESIIENIKSETFELNADRELKFISDVKTFTGRTLTNSYILAIDSAGKYILLNNRFWTSQMFRRGNKEDYKLSVVATDWFECSHTYNCVNNRFTIKVINKEEIKNMTKLIEEQHYNVVEKIRSSGKGNPIVGYRIHGVKTNVTYLISKNQLYTLAELGKIDNCIVRNNTKQGIITDCEKTKIKSIKLPEGVEVTLDNVDVNLKDESVGFWDIIGGTYENNVLTKLEVKRNDRVREITLKEAKLWREAIYRFTNSKSKQAHALLKLNPWLTDEQYLKLKGLHGIRQGYTPEYNVKYSVLINSKTSINVFKEIYGTEHLTLINCTELTIEEEKALNKCEESTDIQVDEHADKQVESAKEEVTISNKENTKMSSNSYIVLAEDKNYNTVLIMERAEGRPRKYRIYEADANTFDNKTLVLDDITLDKIKNYKSKKTSFFNKSDVEFTDGNYSKCTAAVKDAILYEATSIRKLG